MYVDHVGPSPPSFPSFSPFHPEKSWTHLEPQKTFEIFQRDMGNWGIVRKMREKKKKRGMLLLIHLGARMLIGANTLR